MSYHDLREFMDKLDKEGDLVHIKDEVDWNLEVGAIIRRSNEIGGEAALFENIKDYPRGYRILGAPVATLRRLAIALGLKPDSSFNEVLDFYDEGLDNPIKPILVTHGPCKENKLFGEEVDLFKFPVPFIHHGDGGRYIGTWHLVATKDLDTDWVNWGMYRLMVQDKDKLGGLILPVQHIGMIYNKYETADKPMPFAIAIGTEPVTAIVASASVPYGASEVEFVGGIRREPLEVVKCETNDLLVPATSEIVLEGEVLPHERMEEGPFGEYTGYRGSPRSPKPVYHVKAITHRNDPILTVSNMGIATDDGDVANSLTWSSSVKRALINSGIPGIKGVYIPYEGCSLLLIVSVKPHFANVATRIASVVWGDKAGAFLPKIIVVEDDVDPTNMAEVIHAFVTKCHPARGATVIENAMGHPLIPYLDEKEKLFGKSANVVYDCTWPIDWSEAAKSPRMAFKSIYPEEIRERVLNRWHAYGFKKL